MEQWHDNPHFTRQDKREIGDKIKSFRESFGLTQEDLFASTGIDAKVISRNEQGIIRDVESLIKYALAFGCTVDDLLPERVQMAMQDCQKQDMEIQMILKQLPETKKKIALAALRAMLPESA